MKTEIELMQEKRKMTTAIEVYDALPVCEGCGKPYTGLNAYEFVAFLENRIDDPLCDSCEFAPVKERRQGE